GRTDYSDGHTGVTLPIECIGCTAGTLRWESLSQSLRCTAYYAMICSMRFVVVMQGFTIGSSRPLTQQTYFLLRSILYCIAICLLLGTARFMLRRPFRFAR